MSSNNKITSQWPLVVVALLVVVPFVAATGYALLYATGIINPFEQHFTLHHFASVWQEGSFINSILYSTYIAVTAIVLALVVAWTIVLRSNRSGPAISIGWYLPLSIPAIVAAFLSFQLLSKSGWISSIITQLGWIHSIEQFPDLINDTAGVGIIVTHSAMAIPFFVIYFSNLYQSENLKALSDTAATLGATGSNITRKIILPVFWQKGVPTILLYLIFVMGAYEIPLLLGQQKVQMISMLVIRKTQRYNLLDIPQGYCTAVLYTGIVLTILWIVLQRKKNTDHA